METSSRKGSTHAERQNNKKASKKGIEKNAADRKAAMVKMHDAAMVMHLNHCNLIVYYSVLAAR